MKNQFHTEAEKICCNLNILPCISEEARNQLLNIINEVLFSPFLLKTIDNYLSSEYYQTELKRINPFLKCFISQEMEYCWNKIHSIEKVIEYDGQKWLARAIYNSLYNAKYSPRINNGEGKQKLDKIIKSLNLVQNDINQIGSFIGEAEGVFKEKIYKSTFKHETLDLTTLMPSIETCLNFIIEALPHIDFQNDFYGKSVNAKHFERTYFINSLTCGLLQATEKPCRKLVETTTNLIFESSLEKDEITRATRSLNYKDHLDIVNQWELR